MAPASLYLSLFKQIKHIALVWVLTYFIAVHVREKQIVFIFGSKYKSFIFIS